MPYRARNRRFEDLARDRARIMAASANGPLYGGPQGAIAHEERVAHALSLALAAGIPLDDAYPALLRNLMRMGIRLRPIHFMPLWVPFLLGSVFGLGAAKLALLLADALGGAFGPLGAISDAGWPGALAAASAFGMLFATLIRAQSLRAGLPRWSDL